MSGHSKGNYVCDNDKVPIFFGFQGTTLHNYQQRPMLYDVIIMLWLSSEAGEFILSEASEACGSRQFVMMDTKHMQRFVFVCAFCVIQTVNTFQ